MRLLPRRSFFDGWGTAMLAGSLYLLTVVGITAQKPGPAAGLGLLLLGAALGLAILALIRLFGTSRWGFPVAGLLAGPVPLILLFTPRIAQGERGGVVLLGALLGLAIGLLEWARVSRSRPGAG